jgi:hypothetical protein
LNELHEGEVVGLGRTCGDEHVVGGADAVEARLRQDAVAQLGQAAEGPAVPVEREAGVEVGEEVAQAGALGEGEADDGLGLLLGGFEQVVEELVDADFHGQPGLGATARGAARWMT